MRVVILADPIDNQNAGVHVYTKEMVNAMIRTNTENEIILIREKHDHSIQGAKQIIIPNIRLPIGFASFRLFFLVPIVVHYLKADIVIEPAHFGPFNLLRRIKRVTIIHDLTPILFPELHRWHSQILQKIFLKRILNKADLIITNSKNTSKDLCEVYPHNCKKAKRIYPGISDVFHKDISQQALNKQGITKPYFICVGTIEPRKNLNVLLKAYEHFMDTGAVVELVIAGGKGWKSESFFEALKKHPYQEHIIITGFVDTKDLPALYSNSIALIYPSKYEGFGLPIVEAMKCGTPVIAAKNSSLTEAGGDAALYFNSSDSNELSAHMLNIFSDNIIRSQLSEKSLLQASKFNWDKFATELWDAIKN
jgi:glycosyltransferase involved in cell wall biosynthesis